MSDSSDGPPSSSSVRARTRIRRSVKACDECRRRKVKCEESSISDTCSSCFSLGINCTRFVQAKKRGPKPRSYKQQRSNDAKFLISTILSAPKTVIVPKDEPLIREMLVNLATYARDLEKQLEKASGDRPSSTPPPSPPTTRMPLTDTSQDLDDAEESLTIKVQSLSLDYEFYHRHVGKSSHFMLFQTALNIRNEVSNGGMMLLGTRRSEFWTRSPWHRFLPEPNDPPYVFPEPELLHDLITVYFEKQHIVFPVLHQQTFERQVYIDQLHLTDRRFGAVVLAVCALGSKLTNDPRTLSDGTQDLRSAGWRYIEQIRFFKSHFTFASSLYDVQLYSLALIFLFPTPAHELVGWFLVVMGIRVSQECGAHRKGNLTKNPAQTRLEQALWRRAFWSLALSDLYMSTASGRPRSTREDDFDLELPPECDDVYWEIPSNPELEFIQPVGKPSHMAYWHHFIKLLRIAGLVKDHLFTTRKAAPWLRASLDDTKKIVTELDSMLNTWRDELPDYLRWDPDRPDDVLLAQTVMLHSNYYWVEIQIHKTFVRPDSLLTENFPSLAICTHSARAYIHVLEVYHARGMPLLPNYIAPTFVAATMLLINLWTNMRGKSSCDPKQDMDDVHICMKHLARFETRYEAAGRAYDILDAVVSASPIPPSTEKESLKRTRNPETFEPDFMESDSTRQFAGSKRVFNAMGTDFSGSNQPTATTTSIDYVIPSVFDPFHATNADATPEQQWNFSVEDATSHYEPPVDDSASAWSDPSNEDWSSFMLRVDELLKFVNPDAS